MAQEARLFRIHESLREAQAQTLHGVAFAKEREFCREIEDVCIRWARRIESERCEMVTAANQGVLAFA